MCRDVQDAQARLLFAAVERVSAGIHRLAERPTRDLDSLQRRTILLARRKLAREQADLYRALVQASRPLPSTGALRAAIFWAEHRAPLVPPGRHLEVLQRAVTQIEHALSESPNRLAFIQTHRFETGPVDEARAKIWQYRIVLQALG